MVLQDCGEPQRKENQSIDEAWMHCAREYNCAKGCVQVYSTLLRLAFIDKETGALCFRIIWPGMGHNVQEDESQHVKIMRRSMAGDQGDAMILQNSF